MQKIQPQEKKDFWRFEKNIGLILDEKFSPTANTDGLINCLRQPGLIRIAGESL